MVRLIGKSRLKTWSDAMIRELTFVILSMLLVVSGARSAEAQTSPVSFVGCKSDGQVGPQAAPQVPNVLPILQSSAASRLTWYASMDLGVLAPSGWNCFGLYGSNGSTLIVTPESHSDHPFDIKASGPAVQLSVSFSDTSGRFEAAEFAALLFPDRQNFVDRVIAEGLMPRNSFPSKTSPFDVITRGGPDLVDFETPADHDGLGTMSLLVKSGQPIFGRVSMDGSNYATVLTVRVDPSMRDLVPMILNSIGDPEEVVTSFYNALSSGDGEVASQLIVPEKRYKPAFSASGLSNFYGHLKSHLSVIGIERRSSITFLVHYTFATNRTSCDGQAFVTTTTRERENYILSIKALNGC
jgi:hypothetical protein